LNTPIDTGAIVSNATEESFPLRVGNDLYLSFPGEERDDMCSTVYILGTEFLSVLVRKEWSDEDVDVCGNMEVDVEVDVEGRDNSAVLVEESVSTTSTTVHVPLLLSVEEAELVPLDRLRSWSIPIDLVLDRRLDGALVVAALAPEEVGCDLTTRCRPKPVNRAGEVLYRNILGLIGAEGSSRPVRGKSGTCSRADMDARELNEGTGGIDGESEYGDAAEGESFPADDDKVMVAIEVPLDSITV